MTETTDQASEVTTRTDPIDTAEVQAADLAGAEATLGTPMFEYIDPNSPAPRLAAPTPLTIEELRENAKRALLKRIAEMAAGDDTGIENLAEALRAVEYS